jgi:hypothetical protein
MELSEPKWAVPDLIPEGYTLLAGKSKIGKSWLALNLAVAVACGGKVLGNIDVEQGDVLFLALEDGLQLLQERLVLIQQDSKPLPPGRLTVKTEFPRLWGKKPKDNGLAQLEDWLQQHPEARLVVIDTLRWLMPQMNSNANLYDFQYEVSGSLQKLALKHNVAIVSVHHTRKMGAEYVFDEVSGTVGNVAGTSAILVLRRTGQGATLHVTGKAIKQQEIAVEFKADVGMWISQGDAQEYYMSETRHAIIELLSKSQELMRPNDIAEELGRNPSTIRTILRKMVQQGKLAVKNGKYSLAK